MEICNSSGILSTAATAIVTGPCLFYGATVIQASAATSLAVYDSATTSTAVTQIAQVNTTVNSSTNNSPPLPYPIVCNSGIYIALAGTAGQAIIYYSLR